MCLKCPPPAVDELHKRGWSAAIRGHFDSRQAYREPYRASYGAGYDAGRRMVEKMRRRKAGKAAAVTSDGL